jgi:TolB-like protein
MTGFVVVFVLLAVLAVAVGILRIKRAAAHRGLPRGASAPSAPSGESPLSGDDVRFTVYRPSVMAPARWYQLLVFAHRIDVPGVTALPTNRAERVRQEAARVLGRDAASYVSLAEDSAAAIPREGQLTFVPEIAGFRFNPPRASMDWLEDVQNVAFRMSADESLEGTTARGRLTVWWGAVLLAEMALVMRVSSTALDEETASESAAPFRKVFASYSRQDAAVVRQLEAFASALGDQYLIDVTSIRAGERWQPRIEQLIEEADVFQLFWSWNSIRSDYVQREWRHALALGRENFVRPVYWEEPLPELPEHDLPPPELTSLQFQRVPLDARTLVRVPSRRRLIPPASLGAAAAVILALGSATLLLRSGLDVQPAQLPPPPPTEGVAPQPGDEPATRPGRVRPSEPPTAGRGGTTAPVPSQMSRPETPNERADLLVSRFESPRGDAQLERFGRELVIALRDVGWNVTTMITGGTAQETRALARQRGVAWLLSGQIARAGDNIMVNARLTSVDADTVAWSDVFRVAPSASARELAARIAHAAAPSIH